MPICSRCHNFCNNPVCQLVSQYITCCTLPLAIVPPFVFLRRYLTSHVVSDLVLYCFVVFFLVTRPRRMVSSHLPPNQDSKVWCQFVLAPKTLPTSKRLCIACWSGSQSISTRWCCGRVLRKTTVVLWR